jgi:glycosyltransferase involved in cell wall biosynthesis/GT2 family glycosyltransferase
MFGSPVLFLPVIDWSFRVQRPQHLARCFARAGYRVYYPDLRLAPRPRPPHLVESGVWRLALAGDPAHDPYRHRLPAEAVERALAALQALAAEHPLAGCWIVTQLPSWRPLAEAIRAAFGGHLMFDCVDEYAAFRDHEPLTDEEAALTRGADLVVAVTEPLRAKLAALGASCVLVRNGCDPDHFGPVAGRVRGAGPPVAGFFGGIHDWFDSRLLAAVARARPGWQVWLVGDTYLGEVEPLRALANVRFLGELPYADLPRVVSHFDVGIIPFKVTPLTRVTETVKVYEMIAAGLPVVATDLPELRRLAPLVALAAGADDFAACLDAALAAPQAARDARRELARSSSWLERFLELRRAMAAVDGGQPVAAAEAPAAGGLARCDPDRRSLGLLARETAGEAHEAAGEAHPNPSPELSVVVVAGGLRERAGECLRSLRDQGLGERMEVLLADVAGPGAPPVPGSDAPGVRVLALPPGTTFPRARAHAVRAAAGGVVAFVEEHATALPGFAAALLGAHREAYAGVGPAVVNGNPGVGRSDVAGLLAYGHFYPPCGRAEAEFLAGHNSSFKRHALLDLGDDLDRLLRSDLVLHARLRRLGHRLLVEPAAVLAHRNEVTLRGRARGLFLWYRNYAVLRAAEGRWSRARRAAYVAATPVLPLYFLARFTPYVARRRRAWLGVLLRNLPYVVATMLAGAAGQALGLLLGPGDAEARFTRFELGEPRPLAPGAESHAARRHQNAGD